MILEDGKIKFQFHKVQLKATAAYAGIPFLGVFQFHKVQLKV